MSEHPLTSMQRRAVDYDARREDERSQEEQLHAALTEHTHDLAKVSRAIAEQADLVQTQSRGGGTHVNAFTPEMDRLIRLSTEAAEIGRAFHAAAVDHVFTRILLSSTEGSNSHKLLSGFQSRIKTTVKASYETKPSGPCPLQRTLEQCYREASMENGKLNIHNYLHLIGDPYVPTLLDPDGRMITYYDPVTHPAIDMELAAAHWLTRPVSRQRKASIEWQNFWLHTLDTCLDGPTLFWPFGRERFEDPPAPPRYLFRIFDSVSSGISDERVVASSASTRSDQETRRKDLLSLSQAEARRKLYAQFKESCSGKDSTDNLMSWTSSLIVAIQYALSRRRTRECSPAEVKICVVDTAEVPPRQFARVDWLIER